MSFEDQISFLEGGCSATSNKSSSKVKEWDKFSFTDVKFMTAKEKTNVFKNFVQVIDSRNIDLMNKSLYNHVHCHTDFIAHYDLHTFRATYRDHKGFMDFVDRFYVHYREMLYGNDFKDINLAMIDYVRKNYDAIKAEMAVLERKHDLTIMKAIAQKHNISLNA